MEVRVIIFVEKVTMERDFLRAFPVLFRGWNNGLFEAARHRLSHCQSWTSARGCEDSRPTAPRCRSHMGAFMGVLHCARSAVERCEQLF